jgi:hypothetical protein
MRSAFHQLCRAARQSSCVRACVRAGFDNSLHVLAAGQTHAGTASLVNEFQAEVGQ